MSTELRPMYAVQRETLDRKPYGNIHSSYDAVYTLCGQNITSKFVIFNNTHTGVPTCKVCLQQLGTNIIKGL